MASPAGAGPVLARNRLLLAARKAELDRAETEKPKRDGLGDEARGSADLDQGFAIRMSATYTFESHPRDVSRRHGISSTCVIWYASPLPYGIGAGSIPTSNSCQSWRRTATRPVDLDRLRRPIGEGEHADCRCRRRRPPHPRLRGQRRRQGCRAQAAAVCRPAEGNCAGCRGRRDGRY
jgi:hypothetical protein